MVLGGEETVVTREELLLGGGGGDVLPFPYKRLMGMCCWMGSHFDDWIDYNRIAFSIEFLEWGGTFSDFWGI